MSEHHSIVTDRWITPPFPVIRGEPIVTALWRDAFITEVPSKASGPSPWGLKVMSPLAGPTSVSIVIAVCGQWGHTRECLKTLLADAPDAEVIVVDNGSQDGTAAGLRGFPVKVITAGSNLGVPAAWNLGLRSATGNILAVLNNDTLVQPGGIARLTETAARVGMAALNGGRLDRDCRFLGYTDDPAKAQYPDGCCLFLRRDVWESVGEFDEVFSPAYCEDSDYGMRAKSLGYRWEFCRDAVVHLGQKTSGGLGITPSRQNHLVLKERWGPRGLGERILVRRRAALGDIVMLTAALSGLRKKKPVAWIDLEIAASLVDVFQGIPCVDRVVARGSGEYTERFELDGAYEAREIAGECVHPAVAFAQMLEVEASEPYCLPEPPDQDHAWAESVLPTGGAVAIFPRSATRRKVNWRESGWVELVRMFPETTFAVFDPEVRPNLEVHGDYHGDPLWHESNVIDMTGHTHLPLLVAFLRRCRAAISVDTGGLHVAAAAGLPVVAVVASGPGWARAPLTGRSRVVQGRASCYPCVHASECPKSFHCLDDIGAAEVAAAYRSLAGLAPPAAGTTFIVTARDNSGNTIRCLESLRRFFPSSPLIVVDDGSTAEEAARITGLQDRLRFRLARTERVGKIAAIQAAWGMVETPYVVLTDNDVVFTGSRWLQKHIGVLEGDASIGAVGGSGNPDFVDATGAIYNAANTFGEEGYCEAINGGLWTMPYRKETWDRVPVSPNSLREDIIRGFHLISRGLKLWCSLAEAEHHMGSNVYPAGEFSLEAAVEHLKGEYGELLQPRRPRRDVRHFMACGAWPVVTGGA